MSVITNGSTEYLKRTANLPSVVSFTVCGWCRLTSFRSAWAYIAGMEDAVSSASYWTAIGWNTSNVLHVAADNGGGGLYYNFTRQPTTSEWFFFAVTRAGNAVGDLKGYLARESDGTLEVIQNSNVLTSFTPAHFIVNNDSWSEWVDGAIAHVRVWNTVLTQGEIESEWASARAVKSSGLQYEWRLADNADVSDLSGNSYNPTINGTLDSGTHPPVGSGISTTSSVKRIGTPIRPAFFKPGLSK